MNNLLIFFAFPVAVIIFAIALQKLLKCPFLVAAVTFAAFLIVAFTAFDESFLVFAILYSLLALITALVTRFICCIIRNSNNPCLTANAGTNENSNDKEDCDNDNSNNNDSNNCGCNCNRSYSSQYFSRRNMLRR